MISVITLWNKQPLLKKRYSLSTCKLAKKSAKVAFSSCLVPRWFLALESIYRIAQWSPPLGFDTVNLSQESLRSTKNFTPLHEKCTPRKRFECFLVCIAIVIRCNRSYRKETDEKQKLIHALHTVVAVPWYDRFTKTRVQRCETQNRNKFAS